MLAWHAAGTLALLALPSMLLIGPVWRMPRPDLGGFGLLVLAYAVAGLYPVAGCRRGKLPRTPQILLVITGAFGVAFLGLLLTKWPYSRPLLIAAFSAALVVIPVISARPRGIIPILPLAGILLGARMVTSRREPPPPPASTPRTSLVRTQLYSLQVDFFRGAIPRPRLPGGGLSRLGNEYLLMTGDGLFYLFGWGGGQDSLWVRSLPYQVPANLGEFESALWKPGRTPGAPEAPRLIPFWFRGALGLRTQVQDGSVRVFASYLFWLDQRKCFQERVAVLEAPLETFRKGDPGPAWRILYETTPCLPLHGSDRPEEWVNDATWPLAGYGAGGRMIVMGRDSLLLSVGDFEFDGVTIPGAPVSQDRASSYGKTILIHLDGQPPETFSLGHRNPQGLYRDAAGSIWLTEHGPQGGDELNLIVAGANYGWPSVTYGVHYGTSEWPLSERQGSHQGYELPAYAWIPSIGVSDLFRIEHGLFPAWRGDLLVGSLISEHLYRLRTQGPRVVFAESFPVGKRIRALVEAEDGRIVLWTDDFAIGSIMPNRGTGGEALFALRCGSCHTAGNATGYVMGPDLAGVVGRPVASVRHHALFSPGLEGLGGTWTVERLDAFIANPRSLVPGTTMAFPGLADSAERAAIIEYLRTRR